MKKTYQGEWKPYELEALGGGKPGHLRWSREMLIERLKRLAHFVDQTNKIKEIIEEASKKNGGLPF